MASCEFNVGDVRRHRDGIHAPRVMYENGILTMMGRSIPVIGPVQLEDRLRLIGCKEEVIEEIVGNLFGYAPTLPEDLFDETVTTEAAVAVPELVECLV